MVSRHPNAPPGCLSWKQSEWGGGGGAEAGRGSGPLRRFHSESVGANVLAAAIPLIRAAAGEREREKEEGKGGRDDR